MRVLEFPRYCGVCIYFSACASLKRTGPDTQGAPDPTAAEVEASKRSPACATYTERLH